jgi:hypothetical protein
MQFSATVTTVTREAIVPSVSDAVLKGNVGLLRFLGNAKSWRSGYRLDQPVKYQKSTAGGIVTVGGTLDTSRVVTRVKMQFEPQRIHKPVVVDDIELAVNEGDERVLDLLATEMDSIAQDLLDDLGGYLYTGTSATGLSVDSLLNASDDSTNFGTYGAQSRSTYTAIKGYYSASIGALAISDLATLFNNITFGSDGPSLVLTTQSIWTAYEALLQPTVRAGYQMSGYPQVTRTGVVAGQQAMRGDIGFDALWFRGKPVVQDQKCTSQKVFAVSENHFSFFGIDLPAKLGYEKFNTSEANVKGPQALPIPKGFNWSGLIRSQNQPAQVGHLYYVGNFVSDNPRFCGQLTGVTD